MAVARAEGRETVSSLNERRCVGVILLYAPIWVATEVDALIAVLLIAAVTCGLIACEAIRFRETRDRVRHAEEAMVSP